MQPYSDQPLKRCTAKAYVCVFYYCRTYYKAVHVEDMCYERRRAEACVD